MGRLFIFPFPVRNVFFSPRFRASSNDCRGSTRVLWQFLRGQRTAPTETFFLRHQALSRQELTERSRGSAPIATRNNNRWEVRPFFACFPRLNVKRGRGTTPVPRQLLHGHRAVPTKAFFLRCGALSRHELTERPCGPLSVMLVSSRKRNNNTEIMPNERRLCQRTEKEKRRARVTEGVHAKTGGPRAKLLGARMK